MREMRTERDDTKITISTIEMTDRDDTKITVSMLYEASREGSVVSLKSLIEKDPLILSKILFTSLSETPLHISAALGHLDFTKELLKLKPKLASELDFHKRSPLHFAAAEGQVEIARALLLENKDVCSVKDQDGRIPLHHAAMRGRIDVIQLLISAGEHLVFEVLPSGETALHLCVQHNHLEALRLLVKAGHENPEFLNAKELENDDTILHLAVKLKQVETVEYLISIPGLKVDILNCKGYKAFDLLELLPRDFNTLRIQRLMDINQRPMDINKKDDQKSLSCNWQLMVDRLTHYKREWLKEMEGSIMVVATVIAATTFQAAINPPGGVWQVSPENIIKDSSDLVGAPTTFDQAGISPSAGRDRQKQPLAFRLAGNSVMAQIKSGDYERFTQFNSIAFVASLSVIILIVGGFPLKNKVCVWLLTMAMCLTLAFMALTFMFGMTLVNYPHTFFTGSYNISNVRNLINISNISNITLYVWIGLFGLLAAYHTIHFVIWLSKLPGRVFLIRRNCGRLGLTCING